MIPLAPRRRYLGLLLRLGCSLAIIAALFWLLRDGNVVGQLREMRPGYLTLAFASLTGVIGFSALRWQVLLRGYGMHCSMRQTVELYWISLFYMLFLPGSAGADIVRSYAVARDHGQGRMAVVVLATIQERLAGLAGLMVLGSSATLLLWGQLGTTLAVPLLLIQVGALALSLIALYPVPFVIFGRRAYEYALHWSLSRRLIEHPLGQRIIRFFQPASEPLRLDAAGVVALITAIFGSTIMGVATYWLLGRALSVEIGWLALCVATPVVTLARTLPISLNGIGVGEGAFVAMLQPFGIAGADAFALSLAGLALHTLAGLIGGAFYAVQLGTGMRLNSRPKPEHYEQS